MSKKPRETFGFLPQKDGFRCGPYVFANLLLYYGIHEVKGRKLTHETVRTYVSKKLATTRTQGTDSERLEALMRTVDRFYIRSVGEPRPSAIMRHVRKGEAFVACSMNIFDKAKEYHFYLILADAKYIYIVNHFKADTFIYRMTELQFIALYNKTLKLGGEFTGWYIYDLGEQELVFTMEG